MSQALITEVTEILEARGVKIDPEHQAIFSKDVLSVLSHIKYHTGNEFIDYVDDAGEIVYPYAVAKFIAGAIEHRERPEVKGNLKSRSMGSVSYTFKDSDGIYPAYLYSLLDEFMLRRKAKFHVFK
ncbi:head-tail connector protein [Salinicoccus sp. Marseille-QA3877]